MRDSLLIFFYFLLCKKSCFFFLCFVKEMSCKTKIIAYLNKMRQGSGRGGWVLFFEMVAGGGRVGVIALRNSTNSNTYQV